VNPEFPLYIPSKSRSDSRLTMRALDRMRVPYFVIVEAQQHADYAAVLDPAKLLVLDPAYQRDYDACDTLGMTKSKGPGPARNFAWDHAQALGAPYHWVADDNIQRFYRLNRNAIIAADDGTLFRCMEAFVQRYSNVGMAGPNYEMFVPVKSRVPPYITNTRIYSCALIRNDVPFRWRGRYNEDTDLSLRLLKAQWCTVQFNAFLQKKVATQLMAGGNTAEFYAHEGTTPKSRMLVRLHPDVARLAWRWGRCHHHVDYHAFRDVKLIRRPGVELAAADDEFGMRLEPVSR
jgi:hypothetical protein